MKIFKKKNKDAGRGGAEAGARPPAGSFGSSGGDGAAATSAAVTAKLVSHIEQLETSLKEKTSELSETKENLNEAREILREQNKSKAAVEKELEDVERKYQTVMQQQKGAHEGSAQMALELETLRESNAELKRDLEAKTSELEKSKSYFFEQTRRLEAQAKEQEEQARASLARTTSGGFSAIKDELEKQIAKLKKRNEELERQLVSLTGISIMNEDANKLKREVEQLTAQLADEKAAGIKAKTQLRQLKQESEDALELLKSSEQAEAKRRAELEKQLEAEQAERRAEVSAKNEALEMTEAKLKATTTDLEATQERLRQAETSLEEQQRSFEAMESQRVAALDGKTAALLLAEREKVQKEEQRKRTAEIEQIMKDQRGAMEAIVRAVRAEEQMNNSRPAQSLPPAPPAVRASPATRKQSSGVFSLFSKRSSAGGSSASSNNAPVVAVPAAEKPAAATAAAATTAAAAAATSAKQAAASPAAGVPAPVVVTAPPTAVAPAETAPASPVSLDKSAPPPQPQEAQAAQVPERRTLHLEAEPTENTSDVALASLDTMSL